MALRLERHRQRPLQSVLVAVLVVLAVGVSQGVAGGTAAGKAEAPIEQYNANCGVTTGGLHIGVAKFTRTAGDKLKVKFSLDGALPSTKYIVELFDGSSCHLIKTLGKFRTNTHGSGHTNGTASVQGHSEFFATGWDGSDYNDSLKVTLP